MKRTVSFLLTLCCLVFTTNTFAASILESSKMDEQPLPPPSVESVALLPLYCGVLDYTTNDIIRSSQPSNTGNVAYYQWRFTELEAPFNSYEVISPNPTNPNYRLKWLQEVQYGRSYEVAVRIACFPGPTIGDYSATCTIKFQDDVLSTQLQEQYANGIFDFCDVIGADAVGAADRYRWEFFDLVTTVEAYGDLYYRLLRLSDVDGLQLGKTYIVSAYAEVNGMESPVGTLRFMFTNNMVPNTGLQTEFFPCGATYEITEQVQAIEICSAESYTWRFSNTSQAQEDLFYTRSDGSRFIRLNWVTGLIEGDSYDVEVKGFQGGLGGDYSSVCNITIAGGDGDGFVESPEEGLAPQEGLDAELFLHVLQSGSTDGQAVVFQLASDINESVTISLFDMNGRLVDTQLVRVGVDVNTISWNANILSEGVYILKANTQSKVETRKLTVF